MSHALTRGEDDAGCAPTHHLRGLVPRLPLTSNPCNLWSPPVRSVPHEARRRREGAIEAARHAAFQGVREPFVPVQELAPLRCEPRPGGPTTARLPLHETKPGGLLQLPQVAPRIPVRHLEPRHGLFHRAQLVDEPKERCPSRPDLHPVTE